MTGSLSPGDGAARLRLRAGHRPTGMIDDLHLFAARIQVSVHLKTLNAALGGQDALLVPASSGGFAAFIDPLVLHSEGVAWQEPDAFASAWQRWRLAHELAHTLMFRPGRPPVRRVAWTPTEEDFCDAVADALLVPDEVVPSTPPAEHVAVALAHALHAPIASVLRRSNSSPLAA